MLQRTKQQESHQKISLRPGLKDVTANHSRFAKNRRWFAQVAFTASRVLGTLLSAIDFFSFLPYFLWGWEMVKKKKKKGRRDEEIEEEEGLNFTFVATPSVKAEVRIGVEKITILEPIIAESLDDFMRWMQAAGLSVAFHYNDVVVAAGIMEDYHKKLYEDGEAVFSLLIVAKMEEYQKKLIEGGFQVEVFPANCSPIATLLGEIGETIFHIFKEAFEEAGEELEMVEEAERVEGEVEEEAEEEAEEVRESE